MYLPPVLTRQLNRLIGLVLGELVKRVLVPLGELQKVFISERMKIIYDLKLSS